MSTGTRIEWTEATWNVASGCTRVSAGCDHCYIERTPPLRMTRRRFDHPGIGGATGVQLHGDRLLQPFHWRKPRRVFVCSLADLFHEAIPDQHIAETFAVMALSARHTFQVLTKRPARMRALLSSSDFVDTVGGATERLWGSPGWHHAVDTQWPGWPLPNVHAGVTAEDQKAADQRLPILWDTPAAVRWVSLEPLLGPIHLPASAVRHLDWAVIGGESGPRARPMHPRWVLSLRDQCAIARIPMLFKQWGEWAPAQWKGEGGATHAFTGGFYREAGLDVEGFMELGHSPTSLERDDTTPTGAQGMRRVGKKVAGRTLAGRTHDAYPAGA